MILSALTIAALLSLLGALFAAQLIEDSSEIGIRNVLDGEGLGWAEVEANGLRVVLTGTAPTEASRFTALTAAGSVVDSARVTDQMEVASKAALAAPRFSAEILRNDAGLSVIGLIPTETDRAALMARVQKISGETSVSELVDSADYPAPPGWSDALDFALRAVETLPRSKISVEAGYVAITAIMDTAVEQRQVEAALNRATPPGLRVALSLSSPRPVITPFTLRFVKGTAGARFDACSATDEESRKEIIDAALQAGLNRPPNCQIGLGAPSPAWNAAATLAIAAVGELGAGTVTFSDGDIRLIGPEGLAQSRFDRVVSDLEANLPPAFVLSASLPKVQSGDLGAAEFVAIRSPEGLVQLRGRLPDENFQGVVASYAQAAFGADQVHTATQVVAGLPGDWTLRVLTAVEVLSKLSNGAVTVTEETFDVHGSTGNPRASTDIASLLAEKLAESGTFDIRVTYEEKLDPVASIPTPDECEAEIASIQATSKISFEPGSATIDESALGTMDDIASILQQCGGIRLEIQGHTDSQGREVMNLELSQARAQSVLNELRARRVLTSSFEARGYGETQPIADNKTEDGREANRRIEFKLIRLAPTVVDTETTLERISQSGDGEGTSEAEDDTAEGTTGEQN